MTEYDPEDGRTDDRDTVPDDWTPPPMDPAAYYDRAGEEEYQRLDGDFLHRLEWEGTVEYLEAHLPATGHVLDAGGGPGRYAVWLAERGYDVTLVDVSERQVELAREKATEHGVAGRVTARRGDVRSLDAPDDRFDATLCLGGPLSHVVDADGRETAAAELRRVTTPGGPVFASVMGRLAALQTVVAHAGLVPSALDETELLPALARDGTYDRTLLNRFDREPTTFDCHLFRADEFEALLSGAGLHVETLAGLEGIASRRRDDLDALGPDHREAIREVVAILREDRSVVDLSSHLLAVCRA